MTPTRRPRLYLDHNAGCPLCPAARQVIRQHGDGLGNPSSAHAEGRRSRHLLEDARERLAELVGADREGIVFTSGGTEANALALRAVPDGHSVWIGATEHPSLLEPGRRRGAGIVPVDRSGRPDLAALTMGPDDKAGLLSFGYGNHETGVVADLRALSVRVRAMGARLHVDASQALGRLPLAMDALGADLLTLSGHKVGGPVGIGALVLGPGVEPEPLFLGGGQEGGLRAGTEDAVSAAAFVTAAEDAVAHLPERTARWRALSVQLRSALLGLDPGVELNSPSDAGLPNTVNVSFPGRRAAHLVHRLDLEGIAVSHGSACASGSLEPSPVLLAMGLGERRASSSLRVSFGAEHTPDDVTRFVATLARVFESRTVPTGPRKTSTD